MTAVACRSPKPSRRLAALTSAGLRVLPVVLFALLSFHFSWSAPIGDLPPDDGRDSRDRSSTREQKADRQQEERLAQHTFAIHVGSDQSKDQQSAERASKQRQAEQTKVFLHGPGCWSRT